jgi:RNA polymerase sigma-70 factor, ECF subfamily
MVQSVVFVPLRGSLPKRFFSSSLVHLPAKQAFFSFFEFSKGRKTVASEKRRCKLEPPGDVGEVRPAMATASKEEERYVRLLRQGEMQGLAGLYELYADRLYRQILYPCLADEEAAQDVLKETFLTVMERIEQFQWDAQRGMFPWLARIARNRALDRHRKLQRESRGQGAYRQELEGLAPPPRPDQLLSEVEEQQLLQERVQRLLGQLNPRYQKVLELRLFEERSREECAQNLEIQLGTLDVVFHRALKAFRKLWEKESHEDER